MKLPRVNLSDSSIELLKWIGLSLMTLDHINKYICSEQWHYVFNAGRIVMPLFFFVLAYNLARHGTGSGTYIRVVKRLFIFGTLASPAFMTLGGLIAGWWPVNVMFALMVMTLTIYMIEKKTLISKMSACFIFLIGGAVVEFWWPAIAFGLAVWGYCREPGLFNIVIALISLAFLRLINGNYWAFAVIPVIALSGALNASLPRSKWFFYVYYPLHLTGILAFLFILRSR